MILQTVMLAFDPKDSNREIREIFSNDLARTLWLAIKGSGHLTDEYFCSSIRIYASEIERAKRSGTLDASMLFLILSSYAKSPSCGVIGSGEQVFAAELLPFVNGEKNITFEIRRQ